MVITQSELPNAILLPFCGMESYLADEMESRFGYKERLEPLVEREMQEARSGGTQDIASRGGDRRKVNRGRDNKRVVQNAAQLLCAGNIDTSSWMKEGGAPYWASCAMMHPKAAQFSSIKEAASILRGIQRNWASYPQLLYRRTQLIQEALPHINTQPHTFPSEMPSTPMGLFTLTGEHTMVYSEETTSSLPCGKITFVEDHINPPSRAYLKLQEAITQARTRLGMPLPHEGMKCFDAGASPGGWTYVLVKAGCKVLAVDRAPLAEGLMQNPLVTFRLHDAFTIPIEEAGECDMVLSDVACYPERLLEWVKRWINSKRTKSMICTIKVQGKVDYSIVAQFAALPNATVLHLNANKHELTFLYYAR